MRRHHVRPQDFGIAEHLDRSPIMGLQQRLQKIRHRMQAEVRRNVADPQPPPGVAIIGMGGDPRCAATKFSVPFPVLGEKASGAHPVVAVEAKQQIGMSEGIVRPGVDRLAERGDGLVELALVLECIGEVRERLGQVGIDANRFPICADRFLEPAQVSQGISEVRESRSHAGFDADRLAECRDRLIELALIPQRICEIEISVGEVRPDAYRLSARGDRLIGFALELQRDAEIRERLGEAGFDVDRLPECRNRLIEFALILERIAEVGMCFGQVGFDANRLVIGGDRLVEPALLPQRRAKVGKIKWILSILLYRLGDQRDGPVRLPVLLRDNAKQVQHVRAVGLGRQHLPIAGLGLCQSSRLMVLAACP